jgi:hypothetical protein
MVLPDGIELRPEAVENLLGLLASRSRETKLTAARLFGRFVELAAYKPSQLENYEARDQGLYAIDQTVTAGTDLVIFFSVQPAPKGSHLRMIDIVEVIGEAQRKAAETKASVLL